MLTDSLFTFFSFFFFAMFCSFRGIAIDSVAGGLGLDDCGEVTTDARRVQECAVGVIVHA